MKKNSFNFVFVHGWGFDDTFWNKLVEKFENKSFCSEIFKIDLNFFSKKKKLNVDLNLINNKIFIVHSFGLQWFIKNKFDCKVLINFFGSPNFLKFQKNEKKKKQALDKMIDNFKLNPESVLIDFHKQCGLEYSNPLINKQKLLNALNDLRREDLEKEFLDLKCKKVSFFCKRDKIFTPSINKLNQLKDINHSIIKLNEGDHFLPYREPENSLKLIETYLKNVFKN